MIQQEGKTNVTHEGGEIDLAIEVAEDVARLEIDDDGYIYRVSQRDGWDGRGSLPKLFHDVTNFRKENFVLIAEREAGQ